MCCCPTLKAFYLGRVWKSWLSRKIHVLLTVEHLDRVCPTNRNTPKRRMQENQLFKPIKGNSTDAFDEFIVDFISEDRLDFFLFYVLRSFLTQPEPDL